MICFISYFVFYFFSKMYMENPPKKINRLNGFRTKKSMLNQENWDKAQILMAESFKKCAKLFLFSSPVFLAMEVAAILVNSETFLTICLILEGAVVCFSCLYIYKYVDKQL